MIDTVGFKALIDRDTFEDLKNNMIVTERIDKRTGDIEFEYHNVKLDFNSPSWNYKVSFTLTDEYSAYDKISRLPFKATDMPHIRFEYSVPKILLGNNLISVDPCLISESMQKVKDCFEVLYKIELPSPDEWYCYRLDTCANYILENENQVKAYINYLQRLNYPRKIKNSYEDTGIYFPSRQQTFKIYWKGPEFKKHDFDRAKNKDYAIENFLFAQRILRVEVEHRKRLRYLADKYEKNHRVSLKRFEGYPRMADLVEIFDFKNEMERIMAKMLCGTESKLMKTIDALAVLKKMNSERQARSFHHVYMLIVTQGQREAKRAIAVGTYYRALRAFRESGISIITSDNNDEGFFLDKGFPGDFSLDMNEQNKYYQVPLREVIYSNDSESEVPF